MNFKRYSIIGLLLIFTISCSKKIDLTSGTGTVQVKITSSIVDFESVEIKASDNSTENYPMQDTIITINDKFLLRAELTSEPIHSSLITKKAGLKAASNPLGSDIYYKLVIFKDGNYVADRNFIHGRESEQGPLTIQNTGAYTFIAYSLNTTTEADLPPLSGPATGKTVANTYVDVTGHKDFLYYKGEFNIQATSDNINLVVLLKHQFSQIHLEMNSNGTKNGSDGYHLEEVGGNFITSQSIARRNSGTNTTTWLGTSSNTAFTLSAHATDPYIRVLDAPQIVNMASGGPTFEFNRIKFKDPVTTNTYTIYLQGHNNGNGSEDFLIFAPMRPFSSLTLKPGYRHNIKLTLTNTDEYLLHEGQQAVRIAGEIWMLHHLGASDIINKPNTPPTETTAIAGLYGNYYQFGQKDPIHSDSHLYPTLITTPTNWLTSDIITANTYNNWNTKISASNTQTYFATDQFLAAKNTTHDPCPNGYRVPNRFELDRLKYATWNKHLTDRHIIESKRKKGVVLVLPYQGYYRNLLGGNGGFASQIAQSNIAYFWGSYTIYDSNTPPAQHTYTVNYAQFSQFYSGSSRYFLTVTAGIDDPYGSDNTNTTFYSFPVRCIAESQ